MDYSETLQYLTDVQTRGIKLGLDNVTRLLADMGNPQERFPAAVVAGTNGKGSVCSMLASILTAAGIRAGLFTSPHLIRYEERIAVDGSPVSPEGFAAAVSRVRSHIDALLQKGGLESHPTHFEILTAAAFHHFKESHVKAAVMEVGMGGRLDAVSVASTRVAVLTNVGLEHTRFLGSTLEAIASEKAGIFRSGCRAVTGVDHAGALEVIRDRARGLKVPLLEAHRDADLTVLPGPSQNLVRLVTPQGRYERIEIGPGGGFQRENATLAVLAAESLVQAGLDIPARAITTGLEKARWPGRLHVVEREPLVILDGAHNPAGSQALSRSLHDHLEKGNHPRLCIVVGLLREKDVRDILEPVVPRAERVIVTRGRSERFLEPEAVAAVVTDLGREPAIASDVKHALALGREWATPGDAILVFGSLYLVGEAMEALGLEPFDTAAAGAV